LNYSVITLRVIVGGERKYNE